MESRDDLAREIFVRIAQGTTPGRPVPKELLRKAAQISYDAADAFVEVFEKQRKQG